MPQLNRFPLKHEINLVYFYGTCFTQHRTISPIRRMSLLYRSPSYLVEYRSLFLEDNSVTLATATSKYP
jgi:hypothetical protein